MIKVCNCCERIFRNEDDFFHDTSYWRLDEKQNLYFNCSCLSTLMLPKGNYDWYRPEKLLRPEALNIFNKLSLEALIPKLPDGIAHLRTILNKPHETLPNIVEALKREPLILADVLRTASALSNRQDVPFTNIEHAVVYIGIKTLNDLVIAASMRHIGFNTQVFSFQEFWRGSIIAGMIAELISSERNISRNQGGEIYLAACLANAGKIIYGSCLPHLADKIAADMNSYKLSWHSVEASLNSPGHSILGEIAAAFWSLPHCVLIATCYHHTRQNHASRLRESHRQREFISLISVAVQLKSKILDKPYEVDEDVLVEASSTLGLSPMDLEQISEKYSYLKEEIQTI